MLIGCPGSKTKILCMIGWNTTGNLICTTTDSLCQSMVFYLKSHICVTGLLQILFSILNHNYIRFIGMLTYFWCILLLNWLFGARLLFLCLFFQIWQLIQIIRSQAMPLYWQQNVTAEFVNWAAEKFWMLVMLANSNTFLVSSICVSKFFAEIPFFLLFFTIEWKTQAFLGALTKKYETLIW